METTKKAESGANLRAVFSALERAGARNATSAVNARKLALDAQLECMDVNGISNTLSYLHIHSRVVGRNWNGGSYDYYIMRALEERVGRGGSEPAPAPASRARRDKSFIVKVDGPGLVMERSVSGELASRIVALLVAEAV